MLLISTICPLNDCVTCGLKIVNCLSIMSCRLYKLKAMNADRLCCKHRLCCMQIERCKCADCFVLKDLTVHCVYRFSVF